MSKHWHERAGVDGGSYSVTSVKFPDQFLNTLTNDYGSTLLREFDDCQNYEHNNSRRHRVFCASQNKISKFMSSSQVNLHMLLKI